MEKADLSPMPASTPVASSLPTGKRSKTEKARRIISAGLTGILVIGTGMGLWLMTLAVESIAYFIQVSAHAKDPGGHAANLLRSEAAIALGYSLSFLVASIAIGIWRKDRWAGLKGGVVYGLFLPIYVQCLDREHAAGFEWTLVLPIICCPLASVLLRLPAFGRTKACLGLNSARRQGPAGKAC